ARALWDDLVAAEPSRAKYQKELARLLIERGRLLSADGRWDEADREFDRALRLGEELHRGGRLDDDHIFRDVVLGILWPVGSWEQSRRRPEKALRAFQEAMAIWDALAPHYEEDENNLAVLKGNQVWTIKGVSDLQRQIGLMAEALASSR